jgi:hypothetical protein
VLARKQPARRPFANPGEGNDCPRCAEPLTFRELSPQEQTAVEARLNVVEEQLAQLMADRGKD